MTHNSLPPVPADNTHPESEKQFYIMNLERNPTYCTTLYYYHSLIISSYQIIFVK